MKRISRANPVELLGRDRGRPGHNMLLESLTVRDPEATSIVRCREPELVGTAKQRNQGKTRSVRPRQCAKLDNDLGCPHANLAFASFAIVDLGRHSGARSERFLNQLAKAVR